jgi:hypothetical protein
LTVVCLPCVSYNVFRKSESVENTSDIFGALLAAASHRYATAPTATAEAATTATEGVAAAVEPSSGPSIGDSDSIAAKRQRVGSDTSAAVGGDGGDAVVGSGSGSGSGKMDSKKASKNASGKSRGKMSAAEGGYSKVVCASSKPDDALAVYEYVCKTCSKIFKLEQVS